MLIKESYSYN
ncbi:uncharacterized protein FFMR_00543 [Fusarium fujikuroi]|nr:uncharacterized protein FFMR_00543 [Fusarium fujikuroi]